MANTISSCTTPAAYTYRPFPLSIHRGQSIYPTPHPCTIAFAHNDHDLGDVVRCRGPLSMLDDAFNVSFLSFFCIRAYLSPAAVTHSKGFCVSQTLRRV
jgi:hypothetical protein